MSSCARTSASRLPKTEGCCQSGKVPLDNSEIVAAHWGMLARVLLALGLATLVAACDFGTSPEPPVGVRIAVGPHTLNALGDSAKLTATYITKSGQRAITDSVTWRSLTTGILLVTPDGFAIARQNGSGRVEVKVGEFKDTATVEVQQVLAKLTTTWPAETLFVDDTITADVRGLDSNGVAMPLPQPPSLESISGSSVTRASGMTVTAMQPGESRLTLRVAGLTTEVSVDVESPFIDIAAADGFSCGLVSRAVVYCWGLFGPTTSTRPAIIGGLPPISAIDAGTNHVCALSATGEVYCFGLDLPLQHVVLPQRVVAISAGYEFSCALTADGASYCWGWNQDGQIGVEPTGPGAFQPVPTRTQAPPLTSISAGVMIACGVANETIFCWGDGFGSTARAIASTARFKSVSVGAGICAITIDDQPTCLTGLVVMDLTSVGRISQLSMGNGWACALHNDASAECWGQNGYGQLGRGSRSDSTTVGPAPVVGGIPFRAISAGTGPSVPGQHSCAVALDGRGYCWGENTVGQLGNPISEPFDNYRLRLIPTRVTRIRTWYTP